MPDIPIPIVTGPGSQPAEADGAELDILQLPQGMNTYSPPPLPEPEEVADRRAALALLKQLHELLQAQRLAQPATRLSLDALPLPDRELFDQVLGEGEVSIVCREGDREWRIQESVMAGIWRVRQFDGEARLISDHVETGRIPAWVATRTFAGMQARLDLKGVTPEPGVLNAPPLIAEIAEHLDKAGQNAPHVINLTLLPQTEADLGFLARILGEGRVTVLSRGYGNCRVSSTATPGVWWVQYFNSQDKNILNTLEITDVPEVACAAAEDLRDSAQRLGEILEIYG